MNKETIKEFLKPDKKKFGIFTFISILSFLIVFYTLGVFGGRPLIEPIGYKPPCSPPDDCIPVYGVSPILLIDVLLMPTTVCLIIEICNTISSISLLFINVFYWYLLSCLIIFILDKPKLKNNIIKLQNYFTRYDKDINS